MWYEIIPSFAICVGAFALPAFGLYQLHGLVLGNHFRRNVDSRWDRIMYQRDERLTGNAYVVNSLEAIPDVK